MTDSELLLAIYDGMSEMKQDVTDLKQDMREVKQDVSNLKQDVAELKQDVTVLKQDVAELKQDVTNLKQDVAELKQEVTVLKQDVTELKQNVTVLKQDVAEMKLPLENETNHNIQLLAENHCDLVDKLNQAIPVADKALLNEVQISGLRIRVDSLEKEVAEMKDRIA